MTKFIEFKDSVNQVPVIINVDHVAKVSIEPGDPQNTTVIRMKDGHEIGVEGYYADIVKQLKAQHNSLD